MGRTVLRTTVLICLLLSIPGCSTPVETAAEPVVIPGASTGYPDPAEVPDGWAGSAGGPAFPGGQGGPVTTVTTRSQLAAVLGSDLPKVIVVQGTIDLCSDASDLPLSPLSFLSKAGLSAVYPTYDAWVTAYAASCRLGTAATLAADRVRLSNLQKAVTSLKVGSNTTLVGQDAGAALVHGSLVIDGRTNVVIRNLTLSDACDWFPAWDEGENLVNSAYDNLSVTNSTRVWVDHCRLDDGDNLAYRDITLGDGTTGKKWVVHDGLCDITKGSDLVTVSWNRFRNHDKTMLIGSSDSASATDAGKLRVTIHHNAFENAVQRLPRVRFGQVHVYNNWYSNAPGYAVGVGDQARIVSENNVFEAVSQAFAAYDHAANPGYHTDSGSLGVGGGTKAMGTALQVGWAPADRYPYTLTAAEAVKSAVQTGAGPQRFR